MGWKDLIEVEELVIVAPWTGARWLHWESRVFAIKGNLPPSHGWYAFMAWHKEASLIGPTDPVPGLLRNLVRGYLVGDRLIPDSAKVSPNPATIGTLSERVHLIEDGLDRFCRIAAGRVHAEGPLVFFANEFPMGAELEVLEAYLERKTSVRSIRGVCPALDAAFRMESWQRSQAEQRRVELERVRLEEEAQLEAEERRHELQSRLGDGASRREMASVDFDSAAQAALSVGGAEILDIRDGSRDEKIIRYRLDGRRYECICDLQLRIIDSGVCLTSESTGEKGDTYFTLESLPAVIRQADREGVLVVYRHV